MEGRAMSRFHFRCSECDATYGEDEVRLVCLACTERQEPGGVTLMGHFYTSTDYAASGRAE